MRTRRSSPTTGDIDEDHGVSALQLSPAAPRLTRELGLLKSRRDCTVELRHLIFSFPLGYDAIRLRAPEWENLSVRDLPVAHSIHLCGEIVPSPKSHNIPNQINLCTIMHATSAACLPRAAANEA